MDLTKFSTNDLRALQSGDLSKVSTPGLKILMGQTAAANQQRELNVDATAGMSGPEQFWSGAGKALSDFGSGVKQVLDVPAAALERTFGGERSGRALGMPTAAESAAATQADIDEAKKRDAPLMKTGAGFAGNIVGNVATMLPAVAIPGAATIAGAGLVGAASGALMPVASDESRLRNTAIGGAAGPVGIGLGRGVVAIAKGAKALTDPFYEGGRNLIRGRVLDRFGIEAGDLAGVTSAPTVTGARPTLAEQIPRTEAAAGAARLQDSLRLDNEVARRMTAREAENNAARLATLEGIAGTGGQRELNETAREGTSKSLYNKAFATKLDFDALTEAERVEMTKLMNGPAARRAMKEARDNAENRGLNIADPEGSVRGLHMMKLAMDEAIAKLKQQTGAAAMEKALGIDAARKQLVTFIDRMSPDYAEARAVYAAMSKPVNQNDIGAEVIKRGTSAAPDLAGNVRIMPGQLANAMRDEEQLIKRATGRSGVGMKLSDVLEPDQLAKMRGVLDETNRVAAVAREGNGSGSATAQRFATQNVLRQLIGPTGFPQSWSESTLLTTIMKPIQFGYDWAAEPRIHATLADLILDPSKAAAAAKVATPAQRTALTKALSDPTLQQAARATLPASALTAERR